MIVILEDNEDRQTIMRGCLSRLTPTIPIHFYKTAIETIDCLKTHLPEIVLIALDHDLEMIEGEHPQQAASRPGSAGHATWEKRSRLAACRAGPNGLD